ncbi:MAG: protein kinase, partial [Chloroflexota bacterium]
LDHMAWEPGAQIGAYIIDGQVGSGGMATVYKAHHTRLDRDVAIKVMHPSVQADANFATRFDREAKIVAALEHPHLVPVYDFDETDDQPYIVMKYIDGPTLKDVLAERTLTLSEIVDILDAIADALSYAHAKGVLHRDLKPSNVILDEQHTPYLTDFGLARGAGHGDGSLSAGLIIGTPNYVSPEQAEGSGSITASTDVYTLGVMLYEMVVGRLPFVGANPYTTIHKHIAEQPPIPSEINPEIPVQVEMVLLRALEKDPADRYASPRALADAFRAALEAAGLTELSPDRSGVWEPSSAPVAQPATGAAAPRKAKPKRGTGFHSGMLLLDSEESWGGQPAEEIARRRLKARNEGRLGFVAHLLPFIGVNTMIIMGGMSDGDFGLSSFIPMLGWGAGLWAHAVATYFAERGPIEQLYRDFDDYMTDRFGIAWRDTADERDIRKAWKRVREQFEEQKGFVIHAGIFAIINALIAITWISAMTASDGFVFPYPLIVFAGWGIGVVAHWFNIRDERQTPENTASIQAELDIMSGGASTLTRKPKREGSRLADNEVRLTDDGEFTDSTIDRAARR